MVNGSAQRHGQQEGGSSGDDRQRLSTSLLSLSGDQQPKEKWSAAVSGPSPAAPEPEPGATRSNNHHGNRGQGLQGRRTSSSSRSTRARPTAAYLTAPAQAGGKFWHEADATSAARTNHQTQQCRAGTGQSSRHNRAYRCFSLLLSVSSSAIQQDRCRYNRKAVRHCGRNGAPPQQSATMSPGQVKSKLPAIQNQDLLKCSSSTSLRPKQTGPAHSDSASQ